MNEETNETIVSESADEAIIIEATPTKKIEITTQEENHSVQVRQREW